MFSVNIPQVAFEHVEKEPRLKDVHGFFWDAQPKVKPPTQGIDKFFLGH